MRQGTGYAYGDGEDCISYKCEGCGQRVRVTPTQAQHFRGAFTACSRLCVLKARDLRSQQWRLAMGVLEPSEGALEPEEGAAPERSPHP
jgi:hypothetical protein